MTRVHRIQALAAALLICGGLGGCESVDDKPRGKPVIRWVPIEELDKQATPKAEKAKSNQAGKPNKKARAQKPANQSVTNTDLVTAFEKAAQICCPPAAPEPAPTPEPPPPAPVEKAPAVSWPLAGPQIVDALVETLALIRQSTLGFLPNDLVIGKLWDNQANQQRGELNAVRQYLEFVSAKTKPKSVAAVTQAQASVVSGDLEKWWFTRAEKTLDQGIQAMQEMSQAMGQGKIKAPGDPETLRELLLLSASLLEVEQDALAAQETPFLETDNVFYHARGVAATVSRVSRGSVPAFSEAVQKKGAGPDLEQAAAWLDKAVAMDPLILISGDPAELKLSHLIVMAYALERSRESLLRAADRLQ